jgi:hypothetical protein
MVALRCGGGAAAYMAAPRITAPENGDGRFGTLTVRARIRELPLRTVVSIFPRFALSNSTINLGWLLKYGLRSSVLFRRFSSSGEEALLPEQGST